MYVEADYPGAAKKEHIEGEVILHAVIDAEGGVKELALVSGPPELTQAAFDAVRQWHYKKTLLNGEAVEVDTTIAVDFPPRSTPPTTARGDDLPGMPSASERAAAVRKEADALAVVDPETAADIRRLIELNGTKAVGAQLLRSLLEPMRQMLLEKLAAHENGKQIVDRFIQLAESRASSEDFINILVPVYARHFSHEDIKSMIAFFDSPPGRRYVQEAPAYMGDVQEVASEHWNLIVKPEILEQMRKEFPAPEKRR